MLQLQVGQRVVTAEGKTGSVAAIWGLPDLLVYAVRMDHDDSILERFESELTLIATNGNRNSGCHA